MHQAVWFLDIETEIGNLQVYDFSDSHRRLIKEYHNRDVSDADPVLLRCLEHHLQGDIVEAFPFRLQLSKGRNVADGQCQALIPDIDVGDIIQVSFDGCDMMVYQVTCANQGLYIKTIKGNKVFKFKLKLDTINNITVKSGSIEDSITINKVNKKDKSYILKKKSNNKSWQK